MRYAYLIAFLVLTGCKTDPKGQPANADTYAYTDTNTNTVLICKGNSSYAYHIHYCKGLNRCRAAVEKVKLSEAKSLGRTPCGYCYNESPLTTKTKTDNSTVQNQCNAITKKGTRCSRKAKSNGLCWQHFR